MYRDEVISELWRIRDEYATENNHDLKRIVADLQRRQRQSLTRLVDRRPLRRPKETTDAVIHP